MIMKTTWSPCRDLNRWDIDLQVRKELWHINRTWQGPWVGGPWASLTKTKYLQLHSLHNVCTGTKKYAICRHHYWQLTCFRQKIPLCYKSCLCCFKHWEEEPYQDQRKWLGVSITRNHKMSIIIVTHGTFQLSLTFLEGNILYSNSGIFPKTLSLKVSPHYFFL